MTSAPNSGPTPPTPPNQPTPPVVRQLSNTPVPSYPSRPGVPPSLQTPRPQPYTRAPKPLPLKPRRVRGGVKISTTEQASLWSESWPAQRWVRIIEQAAPGKRAVDGLEYASLGQTKSLIIEHSSFVASVQGRAERPYQVKFQIEPLTPEQWEKVGGVMTDQAVYAAKLLAGDLPANIEDVFVPLGLKLFPTEASEITFSCTCADFQAEERTRNAQKAAGEAPGPLLWCKHGACAAYLLAQRLAGDPFVMFKLRGLDGQELLERLRHSRAVANSSKTNPSVYAGRVPGVSDTGPVAFEATRDFWELDSEIENLEAPIVPPPVSHPLLRRLGPSPLVGLAKAGGEAPPSFPLVGLLASCYEVISEATLREELGHTAPIENDPPAPDPDRTSD
ncbi:MAG: hypothetical protein KF805_16325 [Phycisphaeraceae bacterium]|nr:hypothetical protein [Phycisphaeraceae bacterium]